jgi:hypothetical protein
MPTSKKATKRRASKRAHKSTSAPATNGSTAAEGVALATVAVSQPQAFMIDTSNSKFKAVLMYLMMDQANVDAIYHLIQR